MPEVDPAWDAGDAGRHDGCQAMWQAMPELAIADSTLPLATAPDSTPRHDVARARAWLGQPSTGLHAVLDAVGLDPAWFETRALPELRRKWLEADAGQTPCRRRGRVPAAEARQNAIRPRGGVRQPAGEIGAPGAP
jgi:hypothetical protein